MGIFPLVNPSIAPPRTEFRSVATSHTANTQATHRQKLKAQPTSPGPGTSDRRPEAKKKKKKKNSFQPSTMTPPVAKDPPPPM